MVNNGIELLAPAGKWDVMEAVAGAGADAVYLGGKRFNMRMLKPDFNFSDQELKDAADLLHQDGKKIYVTINNLYYEPEINQLEDYMNFLQEIKVDALIIQDVALIKLHRELGLKIPLHASVQMGIGSSEAIKLLHSWGVERAILSKNLSLEEIRSIYLATGMDLEYFAHGDLCVSHTGQCYMSSFAADQGGNRGLCVKPCRWPYKLEGTGYYEEPQYYLAHNDLCLFHFVKLLREAGVVSFKLEGRMRGAEYLAHLVSCYRTALDGLEEKTSKNEMDEAYKRLYDLRIREFTAGNILSRAGLDAVDPTGMREPVFISTPFALNTLKPDDYIGDQVQPVDQTADLSVKIGSLEIIPGLLAAGVGTIILGLDDMRQDAVVWTNDRIKDAIAMVGEAKTRIVVETPRIVTEQDMPGIRKRLEGLKDMPLAAVMVNDYGSLRVARELGLVVQGGYGLNITNSLAMAFERDNGLKMITMSLELNQERLGQALDSPKADLEIMVQGSLCGMITDQCIPRFSHGEEPGFCASYCMFDEYKLVDQFEQKYRIRSDENCRNYIYYPYDLCMINRLPGLLEYGVQHFRIEGQFYSDELLLEVVRIYQAAIDSIINGNDGLKEYYEDLLSLFPGGLCCNNAADIR
ncbi:MAG: peptidase U32 family protein [Deltaproteobacteria bacterium]